MTQPSDRLRLALEARDGPLGTGEVRRQDLQCHPSPKRNLVGEIDDSHASPADLVEEPKVAEDLRVLGNGGSLFHKRNFVRRAREQTIDELKGFQPVFQEGSETRVLNSSQELGGLLNRPAGALLQVLDYEAIDLFEALTRDRIPAISVCHVCPLDARSF